MLTCALTTALTAAVSTGVAPAHAYEPPAVAATPAQHLDSVYPTVGNPWVDVRSYDLDLRWEPTSRTLRGTARIRLVPARDNGFKLDLSGRLRVDRVRVTGPSGEDVPATAAHPLRWLSVSAPGMAAGSSYTVTVGYHGRPGTTPEPTSRKDLGGLGWHTGRDGQVWAMQEPWGAFTWYPVNDHPSDKATYQVRLDVPSKWVGVSNGRLLSRWTGHGRTVTRFTSGDPIASYLTTVAIGPYVRATQTGPHGLPLTYWVPRDRTGWLRVLRATPSLLTWLEARLGPYPFDRAGVVVTPGDSAMETQTLVTFGADNFRYGPKEVRQTLVHELAHHWYGDSVTPDDWSDLWMNEGMAMYLEAAYTTDQGWQSWPMWRAEVDQHDALWRQLYGAPGAYEHDQFAQINVYYSTMRMLVRLRDRLGAAVFDDLVRRWPQEHPDSIQDRTSYVTWLAASTGEDYASLRAFFDEWLTSPSSPS